jgi:hypothetical protein
MAGQFTAIVAPVSLVTGPQAENDVIRIIEE